MASVRCIDDALGITLNENGRLLRNIIHGADTVMSHILHFYHLSAVDFIDVSALGSPWGPQFGVTSNAPLLPIDVQNLLPTPDCIVLNYVKALDIRRDAHTLGAIFSGRQPIQNAIVPGGVSCMVTKTDIDTARILCNKIRNFINTAYLVDVVTVASRTAALGDSNALTYWTAGTNPGHLLAYGEYPFFNEPFQTKTDLLLDRGTVAYPPAALVALSLTSIKERVKYSYYTAATDNLHPSVGVTTPLSSLTSPSLETAQENGPQYSWLKAPRYGGLAHEVGPIARMVATYLANSTGANTHTVSDIGAGISDFNTILSALSATVLPTPAAYTVQDLVTSALDAVSDRVGVVLTANNLFSPLGRHACRALECKYIADALGGDVDGLGSWLDQLTLVAATDFDALDSAAANNVAFGYTYYPIPKKLSLSGTGLAEAPRGALGHWISIVDQKIANYQCVVPTTWNNCPKGSGPTDRGPSESALYGIPVCVGNPTVNSVLLNDAVLNISRMLHPYDFCIACAVHVVTPEGKELAKFKMDTDGKITKFPVDSE